MEEEQLKRLQEDHKAIGDSLTRAQGTLTQLEGACAGLNQRLLRTWRFLVAGPQPQDVAIGFVIAAAASALVAKFPSTMADSGFFLATILLSSMLLFLALTWISYIAIRGQLPQNDGIRGHEQDHYSRGTNAAKFLIEFLASCSLAICCVVILDHASQFLTVSDVGSTTLKTGSEHLPACNAAGAFGVFALLSWVWNLLALYAMKGLRYSELARATVLGRVAQLGPLRERYAVRCLQRYDARNTVLNNRWATLVAEKPATLGAKIKLLWPTVVLLFRKRIHAASIDWLAEMMAFHVAFANVLASAILILHTWIASGLPILSGSYMPWHVHYIPVPVIAVALSFLLFVLGLRVAAATLMVIGFVLAYTLATPYVLMCILAVQQILGIPSIQFYFIRPEREPEAQAA